MLSTTTNRLFVPLVPRRGPAFQLLSLALVVTIADLLLFGHAIGIGVTALAAVLIVVSALNNHVYVRDVPRTLGLPIFVAGALPIAEDVSLLALIWLLIGVASCLALIIADRHFIGGQSYWRRARALLVPRPLRLFADTLNLRKLPGLGVSSGWLRRSLRAWLPAVVLGVTFLWLFVSANPIIDRGLDWFLGLDFVALWDGCRVLFWIVIACLVWPLIRIRFRSYGRLARGGGRAPKPAKVTRGGLRRVFLPGAISAWLSASAITRTLLVSNALFAIQSVLDLSILWAGATLPANMSYAEYAHRGAYPLLITVLIAAGFVCLVLRTEAETRQSSLIRGLIYLWLVQSVGLLCSAALRLVLYVQAYHLTEFRFAAFVWMGLVAIGLVLIATAIWRRRTPAWLLTRNAASAAVVLYGICFFNVAAFVGTYNVEASYNVEQVPGGQLGSSRLDVYYLCSLGPSALPAIDRAIASSSPSSKTHHILVDCRGRHEDTLRARQSDWRSWSYRDYRILIGVMARHGLT